jgi:polyhydroxyalkanoate synthesis regulator phasin
MPQPKRSTGQDPDAHDDAEEAERSALDTMRELLARSLMLPSDRVRETVEDAVRRGRITRDDAEELVDRLMLLGRQQTDDAVARLEALVRPPGTDRVLREVERARRVAGLGSSGVGGIARYDDLTAAQIVSRLSDLDDAELRRVLDYEKRNANRKSVLTAVEKKLR